MGRIKHYRTKWYSLANLKAFKRPAVPCCTRKKLGLGSRIVRFKIRPDGDHAYCPECKRQYVIEHRDQINSKDQRSYQAYRFVSVDPAPSDRQYYCEKCKKYHTYKSKIGKSHDPLSWNPKNVGIMGGDQVIFKDR